MAKTRSIPSENNIAEKIKKGYGSGEGKNYKPWISIHDFPSLGRVSRVFGWKTSRTHHFMSDQETKLFYLLEWSDRVVDIREQFPLLDRNRTKEIAKEKDIKYPINRQSQTPVILTSDFMITVRDSCSVMNIVRTVKLSEDLNRSRKIENLEIERCYWEEKGIDWGIVTDGLLPSQLTENIERIHFFRNPVDLGYKDQDNLSEMIHILKQNLFHKTDTIQNILDTLDLNIS